MRDQYRGFARRYDLSFDRIDDFDPAIAGFFQRLLAQQSARRILDCACGTGRHLLLLCSLGYKALGSDISPAMLACAHQNLSCHGVDVPLLQADFCHLPWSNLGHFDAILCLGAIGHLPGEREILQAFRSMRSVLRDGGILVLTAIVTDKQWAEKPRFCLARSRTSFARLYAIDYLEKGARYNILDIHLDGERGRLEVWSTDLRALLKADQERLLKQAGFGQVAFYGDFDWSPFSKMTSKRLIAVAYTQAGRG